MITLLNPSTRGSVCLRRLLIECVSRRICLDRRRCTFACAPWEVCAADASTHSTNITAYDLIQTYCLILSHKTSLSNLYSPLPSANSTLFLPHASLLSSSSPLFYFTTHSIPTSFFFFFNDPAPPEISPLPLHDALPI